MFDVVTVLDESDDPEMAKLGDLHMSSDSDCEDLKDDFSDQDADLQEEDIAPEESDGESDKDGEDIETFELPTLEEIKEEAQDLQNIHHRIQEVVNVLCNFKKLRQPDRHRKEYVAVL